MSPNTRYGWMKQWPLLMLGAVLVLGGCASRPSAKLPTREAEAVSKIKAIHNIAVAEDATTTLVTLDADQPLMYTAVKHQYPVGVVLYFPDTVLKGVAERRRSLGDSIA